MTAELPKDAEGREIPFDTKVLYDMHGFKNNVKSFIYVVNTGTWRVKFTIGTSLFAVSDMYLDEHDSWEQLEKDLTAFHDGQTYGPCHYFHELGDDCTSCPARDDACADAVMRDVASRIRNLRGEGQ